MEEKHLNRIISVNKDGRLCIDDQEVDSDMILFEEEAKNLLEEELMEGPHFYSSDEDLSNYDCYDEYLDSDDYNLDDDIFFRGGYYDISNDEFDAMN